jgi:hypothetical protein
MAMPAPPLPSSNLFETLTAPWRLALEGRAGLEYGALLLAQPLLRRAPRGDGRPVLVLPRMLGGDIETQPLRGTLEGLGFRPRGWDGGINLGPREGVMEHCRTLLATLFAEQGRKVGLIGWSLGGLYARVLAKQVPQQVHCVIGLGTPLSGTPAPEELWRLFGQVTGQPMGLPTDTGPLTAPPPVPTTAIYSRSDGIVPWRHAREAEGPLTENIEVESSHFGLAANPLAVYAVADRLAQPEGAWQPFSRSGARGWLFPDPGRQGW